MKIKEFFKNCAFCHNVWIFVYCIDESGKRQFDARGIYYLKDLNDFINEYGNVEMENWSADNCKDYTEITFYLKG